MGRVFAVPELDDVQSLRRGDGPWDSLRHVELLFAVEDMFGVQFTETDFSAIASPVDLLNAVDQRLAAKAVQEVL